MLKTKQSRVFFLLVCFILLVSLFAYLLLNNLSFDFSRLNPTDSNYLQKLDGYPYLSLILDHPNLQPANDQDLQASFRTLLNTLGYQQEWHTFHYGPHIPHPDNSTTPEELTIKILPITAYKPQQDPPLFNIYANAQGEYLSGYFCETPKIPEQLTCSFFLSPDFFSSEKTIEELETGLAINLAFNLKTIGNPYTNNEVEDKVKLQEAILKFMQEDQLIFAQPRSSSLVPNQLRSFFSLGSLLHFLVKPAYADTCLGDLWCQQEVTRCYCRDNETRCQPGEYCYDQSTDYYCPLDNCETTCEGQISFSPQENCYGLDDYPICYSGRKACGAEEGVCDGDALGSCYPPGQSQPNPPPPPIEDPECPGTCCPDADGSCNEAITGTCPAGYTCCDYCATGGGTSWPPYGTFHTWLFYDVNRNGEWDAGDQAIPAEITSEVTITATTTAGGERGSWSAGTVHSRDLTWPDWQRFENAGNYSACFKGSASSPFKSPLRRGRGLRGSGLEPA